MFDDIRGVRFVQITFEFIVISLRLCEGVPIDLSGMLENRVDFNATQCVSHNIVTPFDEPQVREE